MIIQVVKFMTAMVNQKRMLNISLEETIIPLGKKEMTKLDSEIKEKKIKIGIQENRMNMLFNQQNFLHQRLNLPVILKLNLPVMPKLNLQVMVRRKLLKLPMAEIGFHQN